MPEYPNTPFADGQEWTADLAYKSFYCPIFDGNTTLLGHRAKIADAELDDNGIKSIVNSRLEPFKILGISGRVITIQSTGVFNYPEILYSTGNYTLPPNVTGLLYLDDTCNYKDSITNPVPPWYLPIAYFTTNSTDVTSIETNLRWFPKMLPNRQSTKTFGGRSVVDEVASNGALYNQGIRYFRNFTVPAGVTIYIDKYAKFFCSGNFTNNGTIIVNQCANGGTPFIRTLSGGVVWGGGAGAGLGIGTSVPYAVQPYGTGGNGGQGSSSGTASVLGAAGGAGGGGFVVEAAGTITVTGTIRAKGGNGGSGTIYSGTVDIGLTGGGGGSGGLIYLSSLTSILCNSGSPVLDVSGGSGGLSLVGGYGGAGGSGGWIVLSSPSINTTGATLNISGGSNAPTLSTILGGGDGGGYGGQGGVALNIAAQNGQILYQYFVPLGN
jgi:hypothetical protein